MVLLFLLAMTTIMRPGFRRTCLGCPESQHTVLDDPVLALGELSMQGHLSGQVHDGHARSLCVMWVKSNQYCGVSPISGFPVMEPCKHNLLKPMPLVPSQSLVTSRSSLGSLARFWHTGRFPQQRCTILQELQWQRSLRPGLTVQQDAHAMNGTGCHACVELGCESAESHTATPGPKTPTWLPQH